MTKTIMIGELFEDSPKGAFTRLVDDIETSDLTQIADMLVYIHSDFFDDYVEDEDITSLLERITDDSFNKNVDKLDKDLSELASYNVGFNYYQK